MLNLMAFEGEEMDIPVRSCVFSHDLSCLIVLKEMVGEVEGRYASGNGFINI